MEPLNNEQQLGILIARLEEMASSIERLEAKHDALDELVKGKFRTAEVVFKTLKFIGLASVAVLSFKFGDVSKLWQTFFGG